MSKGAMVYGIVIHDFVAERPDELEAKAGEAIIVIAQSNAEWFVAKPIGRLGGPGLIPVTFIEVRDMTTGQAVPDVQRAVQQAGVPKVEEWKKMAAEYKKSSITLGKFETGNAAQAQLRESMRQGDPAYAANGNGYVSTRAKFAHARYLLTTSRCMLNPTNKPTASRTKAAIPSPISLLPYPHPSLAIVLRTTSTGT